MPQIEISPPPDDLSPCNVIHPATVQKVAPQMPPETILNDLADFYKLFSDKTRVGILWALNLSEMCVCDLSLLLKVKQPAISQHLKSLRQMRLVRTRREGKVVYYALADDHVKTVLETGWQHIGEPVGTGEVSP